ncbi:hypothetical protein Taro_004781 [Colocasia esculenta]|uniref:Cytochrome P450 n=1 Tax=Colocasia esculenta TaxID=4460 RepID=A0A843TJ02_COLES|nr:hypothetical protein [Colocasia esculenta]
MATKLVEVIGQGSTGSVDLYLLCSLLSLLALYVFFLRPRTSTWKKSTSPSTSTLPPGPPRLPIIGNLHQFLVDHLPHRSLRRLSDRYGPLMYVQLGAARLLVVSSAEAAQQVLRTHDLAFSDRPPLRSPLRFSYGRRNLAGAPYGEEFTQTRKLVMSTLLGGKKHASLRPVREDEVGILVSAIARLSSGGPVNLTEMALCLFNNINRRVISGRRLSDYGDVCKSNPLHQMFLEVNDLIPGFSNSDLFPSMPWLDVLTGRHARIEKRFRDIDRFLEGEIDVNEADTDNDEMMDADGTDLEDDSNYVRTLLRLQKDPKLRLFLTRDRIKAIILASTSQIARTLGLDTACMQDMFIGGAQSSMASVEWAMAELMMKPEAMKKAQEEVRRVAGGKDRIDEDDLQKLEYMKLVMKETWRLHPTGPLLIPRQCREDCDVGGYTVPAGTLVHVNVWAIGRDPAYWRDPEVFRPERFEDVAVDYRGQNFVLIPFGSGRRMCPGMAPGVARLELALANLLLKFNWELPAGLEKHGLDMEEAFGISNRRRSPLVLKPTVAGPTPP